MTKAATELPGRLPVIVVMGVTGSGKTTIGQLLARRMQLPFYDADDFHPKANQFKLANDVALDDSDREPWLSRLVEHLHKWAGSGGAVLACSALKHEYRSRFRRAASDVRFIYLEANPQLIADRLKKRAAQGAHVVSDFDSILQGQYRDLEVPTDAFRVDISQTPEQIVDEIIQALSR